MNTEKTPIKEFPDAFSLFKPSWKAFQLNFETFVWQILLPTAIAGLIVFMFIIAAFIYGASGEGSVVAFILAGLLAAVGLCFIVAIFASLVVTELRSARNQHVSFSEALREVRGNIWRLLGLFILVSLAVGIGLILFILPGVFALQRLLLSPYYLIDQKTGVWEAMRRSWRDGKDKQFSGAIWGVVGIIIAINIISWVPFVGWLAMLILTIAYLCAPAIRYIQIVGNSETSPAIKT